MKHPLHSSIKTERDESKRTTVLTITLDDGDLARHHLVPLQTSSPVDVLANYALHCLKTLLSETVEEKYRQLMEDLNNGFDENYKPGLLRHVKD